MIAIFVAILSGQAEAFAAGTAESRGDFFDGSARAPDGQAQLPNLLRDYPVRPAWRVAGVDYRVGPRKPPIRDPAFLSMPGVTVDRARRIVRVAGDKVTLDGYDFSLHGGYYVIVTGNNCTIANSAFVMGSNPAPYLVQGYGDGLTLRYNTLDGIATTDRQSGLVAIYGGNPTIQYNWLKNFGQHVLEMNQSHGAVTTLDFRFNLIERGGLIAGSHLNYLQWAHGTAVNPVVAFNTTYQTQQAANGEGFQFDGYADASVTGAVFNNNTMVTAASGGSVPALSYLVHLPDAGGASGIAWNNYVDISSAYGAVYPVEGRVPWSVSGNHDLRTGRLVAVSGVANEPVPDRPRILAASFANGTLVMKGIADANSKVTVFDTAHRWTGGAAADTSGGWTLTIEKIAPGTYGFLAVASGAAGGSLPSPLFSIAPGGPCKRPCPAEKK